MNNQNYRQSQYDQSNQMGNQYGQQNMNRQNQYQQQQFQGQNQSNFYGQTGGQYQTRQQFPGQQQTGQYQTGQQTSMQQPMVIKNPSSNIVQNEGPQMNDRDYLNDALASEKYLTDNYNIFAREASHTDLHNDLRQILNETHDCTRDLFNQMFKHGFYSFPAASAGEIQQAQQKFSKYINNQDPYSGQGQNF